jgi:hypothetical protein
MKRFRRHFDRGYRGHSMRAGGMTMLARNRVEWHIIKALGRWSSDTFETYIQQHPLIIYEAKNALPREWH